MVGCWQRRKSDLNPREKAGATMAFGKRGTLTSEEVGITVKDTKTRSEVENTLRTIFKRCVECPPDTPACPTCGNGEICSLIPQDCGTCAHATCIENPSSPPSKGANVGAIAGGVIGGIVFVSVVVFLVWRFWIKKKRERQDRELEEEWEEDDIAHQKSMDFRSTMGDAASTRTRGSLANSILSRASNIIQIAYIPGVTNRNNSSILETNPVPPIPAALRGSQTPKSPLSNEGDALFFRPGDLRDSTWSATSSIRSGQAGNRDTQYTMKSITPSLARSSMASELYQSDVPAIPATTVARAAPRMVSVKSSNSTETMNSSKSPASSTDNSSKGPQIMMPVSGDMPSKQNSVRGKAKKVVVGGKGRFPISRQVSEASSNHAPNRSSPLAQKDEPSADESGDEEHARARKSLLRNETTGGSDMQDFATPAAQPAESPFFDATEAAPAVNTSVATAARPNPYASMASTVSTETSPTQKRGGKGMGGLSAVLEEATKRASRQVSHEGLGGRDKEEQGADPFSDSHSTK